MKNPYENEPSSAEWGRLEVAYEEYVRDCAEEGEEVMSWDDWLDRRLND